MNTTTMTEPGGETEASGRQRRSRARIASLVAGLALLLTGIVMLSYVAWQYYGTDIIAKRKQADIREDLLAQWDYPTVADVLGPQSGSASLGSAQALIRIPAFGDDYEVPMIEGVRDSDLKRGIGHFPGTGPGQIGNFALAAHRVTNGEPFRDLPELRPGDEVIVETADATYTYELDTDPNDLEVSFTENWVIDRLPVAPEGEAPPGMPTFESSSIASEGLITLTTCSELFHTDYRLVAFGHLVTTTTK